MGANESPLPESERTPAVRFDLRGRTALIAGGSRGLGRSCALAFAAAGADLVIASRKLGNCEALAEEITASTGRRAIPVAAHVGRWADMDVLADAAYDAFGHVDVLVNNAGISPLYPDATAITEELWDKVLDVNLKGPFRLTALVGSRMAGHGGGSVINVSSVASRYPGPDVIPYAAAKAGLNALTQAFAHAWAPLVRVNAILPGAFLTDISKSWDGERFARRSARFALRRGGQPDEIVGAALYLATDASSYTTGALLDVNGGYMPDIPD
jgi:NAD(P)-dependent dehydrogenase (short-subunit alcohol dehydrogenase family)